VDWRPRLFRAVQGGPGGPDEGEEDLDFIISAKIDAPTPQEQVKQILNIAAILPGQQPNRRFSIPERNYSLDKVPTRQDSQPQNDSHVEAPAAKAATGNLIDVGEEPVVRPATTSASQQSVPNTQNGPPAPPRAQSPQANLIDVSDGVNKLDLNSGNSKEHVERVQSPSLRRMDTETKQIDEFHDAEA